MKKLFSFVLSGLFLLGLSAKVNANIFTFNQTELLNFRELNETGNSYMALLEPGEYGREILDNGIKLMPRKLMPQLLTFGRLSNPAEMSKGINVAGSSLIGGSGNPTTADLGALTLVAFENYGLNFHNLGDCIWSSEQFLETRGLNYYEIVWRLLYPGFSGKSSELFLGSSGLRDLDDVRATGFRIGSNSEGNDYQIVSNNMHMKISPVPEPGSMFLILTGFLGLAGFARKRIRGQC